VFTAGVGEFHAGWRGAVCAGLEHLGIKMDPAKNDIARTRNAETCIPRGRFPDQIFVIPTDEDS
jgi:acetate kinase